MSGTSDGPADAGAAGPRGGPGGEYLKWVPDSRVCEHKVTLKNCIKPKCHPGTAVRTEPRRNVGMDWLVAGEPFGYSSRGEQAWKATMTAAIPSSPVWHSGSGLLADF